MKVLVDKATTQHLTATDRCDRCSARAKVQTSLAQGGSLLWCAHHFASFQKALDTVGATILADQRDQ